MNENPQLLVYKASAGSGKTFTLAVEYIKHLIRNPYAYRHILAVTFTNKATTEMKERILGQLLGIWMNDKDSSPYLAKLTEELQMDEKDIRESAGKALNFIIHDYSRFRVETIDSFFQSVMKNLSRELELGANMTIELDNTTALSEAVDSMIEKLDRNSPILHWLLDYIEERIQEDKQWKVANEIKGFGKNIFNEEYIEKGKELRKTLEDKDCIKNYRRTLKALEEEASEQMKGFAEQFFGILEINGLSIDDLNNKKKGIASYFNKLMEG
ncbi:MAG: UvrD-helicase domain-containing protein, partial [Bacteroidaceae bacterium]|nr:UvrD-helicase domain-containing protein [Bacteroidaceae bacterium]